jgi:hypothetical protein
MTDDQGNATVSAKYPGPAIHDLGERVHMKKRTSKDTAEPRGVVLATEFDSAALVSIGR